MLTVALNLGVIDVRVQPRGLEDRIAEGAGSSSGTVMSSGKARRSRQLSPPCCALAYRFLNSTCKPGQS